MKGRQTKHSRSPARTSALALLVAACSLGERSPQPGSLGAQMAQIDSSAGCVEVLEGQVACSVPVNSSGQPDRSKTACFEDRRHAGLGVRICTRWTAHPPYDRRDAGIRALRTALCADTTTSSGCRSWKTARPFDGLDPHAIDHPWCSAWGNNTTLCVRSVDGVLECAPRGPSDRENDLNPSPAFRCRDWKVPEWCLRWTDGTQERSHFSNEIVPAVAIAPLALKFVRCLETKP